MPIVTIQVDNDFLLPRPISGVVVEVYDLNVVFQTSGVTDSDGQVIFTLPDGTYDVLFYKAGVSILPSQPQRITVDSLLGNGFAVKAHERVAPESLDPLRTTVYGTILGADGRPTKTKLVFAPVTELSILSGNIIDLASRLEISSDDNGYFQFELLRDTDYWAYFLYLDQFLGMIPPARLLAKTPDQPNVQLQKLLFPLPLLATFSSTSIALPLGLPQADESLSVDIFWNDGSTRWASYAWAGLQVSNNHPEVVDASVSEGVVVLKPLSAGTATISIERLIGEKAFFKPLDPFSTNTLTVVVA